MMDIVYTVGHSNLELEELIELLKGKAVDLVLDVRSTPWSKRYPQFNRESLARDLALQGIAYEWFGTWFGARQTDESHYMADGWLNYASYTASPDFLEGVRQMDRLLEQGKTPVLMCAEKDPFGA